MATLFSILAWRIPWTEEPGRLQSMDFPGGSDSKESACNAGDLGLIPGQEDPLEKGVATHSRILVWRIPWTEDPGRLLSMGWQRVGHN